MFGLKRKNLDNVKDRNELQWEKEDNKNYFLLDKNKNKISININWKEINEFKNVWDIWKDWNRIIELLDWKNILIDNNLNLVSFKLSWEDVSIFNKIWEIRDDWSRILELVNWEKVLLLD